MDIILVHIGSPQPPFMKVCINQIRHFTQSRIIEVYDGRDYYESKIMRFLRCCDYLKDFGMQNFWLYAMLRLYLVEVVMDRYGMIKALHIENDNLIYDDPDNTCMAEYCGDSVGLTQLTDTELSAGVMYVGSREALSKITDKMIGLVSLGVDELKKKYGGGMCHEMRLLKIIYDENPGLIKLLPNLPGLSSHVFDPASWGQWVGGTFQDPGKPYAGTHHIVGRELIRGFCDVAWEDGKYPLAVRKRQQGAKQATKLFNLHIHSKDLERWKSYGR
jgi:hypothetical protein